MGGGRTSEVASRARHDGKDDQTEARTAKNKTQTTINITRKASKRQRENARNIGNIGNTTIIEKQKQQIYQ